MATKAKPAAAKKAAPAAKKAATAAKKAPAAKKVPAAKKAPATKKTAAVANGTLRPVKDTFTKASLAVRVAEEAGVELKAVKATFAALENIILGAVQKKGAKEFTFPGLLKIAAVDVPAKKKRFGKDPFTGQERWFDPKPATVKLKVRPLKKLKDAAL